MDFIKKAVDSASGKDNNQEGQQTQQAEPQKKEGGLGGFLGGLGDRMNEAAGGGKKAEEKEDYLDKGIDYVQEHVFKQGKQDNESAIEQAKDEQIAGFIRNQYKGTTGSEFPIKDKQ